LQLSSATSFVIIPLDALIAYDLIAYDSDGFINQTLSLLLSARPSMASASWCNPYHVGRQYQILSRLMVYFVTIFKW